MTTPDYEVFAIDLPEDVENFTVSHAIKLGDITVRVLAEPHQYNVLKGATDPLSTIRAFVHPEDWAAFDRWAGARRNMGDDTLTRVFNAIIQKPTGHPTIGSSDSPAT
jgi:hypothetical protein